MMTINSKVIFRFEKYNTHIYVQANKHWRIVARKINIASFCVLTVIEAGVIIYFFVQVNKSKALEWPFSIIQNEIKLT